MWEHVLAACFKKTMIRSAIVLCLAVSGCVLTAADELQLADGSYFALANRLEALEGMIRQQARAIDDLVAEKQMWQQDKTSLLADNLSLRQEMVNQRLTVKRLEIYCYRVDGTSNENEAADLPLKPTNTVKESHTHAVFVRSDDTDPLVPVLPQLTERVNQVSSGLQALTNHVNEVSEALPKVSASVFVNWGSSVCPNSSELVYSGAVGGSYYNETGASVNYLCLPLSDVTLVDSSIEFNYNVRLYGGEYQTSDTHYDKDPVCAVCRSSRATNVMIPATTVCPAGWTSEYSGWLMGGIYWDKAASEFICVNSRMEERQGSEINLDGKLLYYTVTVCGSLPCPPYVSGKRVTCVVCSK